ncbi:hypothetical protein [Nonomuraea rubra]|uniref:hypothetical protein n=1 Tax=Nonomuraea rubra TaxID=46180 RepID=UPI0033D8C0AA
MPQVRIMGDNAANVQRVAELLLDLIAGSPELHAGDPTDLGHRGGGARIVFDVSARPREAGGRERVQAERVETTPARRPRPPRSPRALPPA